MFHLNFNQNIIHTSKILLYQISGLCKFPYDFKTNWDTFQKGREEKEGNEKKRREKEGEKEKRKKKQQQRQKIEVWWATKKGNGKQKKIILPLRFWEGFQNRWNNIKP